MTHEKKTEDTDDASQGSYHKKIHTFSTMTSSPSFANGQQPNERLSSVTINLPNDGDIERGAGALNNSNGNPTDGDVGAETNNGASSSSWTQQQRARMRQSFRSSRPEPFDNELLRRAVSDVGRWAYGIILVEVWALNHDNTALYRPEMG